LIQDKKVNSRHACCKATVHAAACRTGRKCRYSLLPANVSRHANSWLLQHSAIQTEQPLHATCA
jgi:hypothetical protein